MADKDYAGTMSVGQIAAYMLDGNNYCITRRHRDSGATVIDEHYVMVVRPSP